jgi:hypothetical protein
MTAPVRVKLSLPSFGRGFGPRMVSASPGGSLQAALLGSRVAVIPGRVCHPVSTHPSTTRRGRQLSSSQSAPAAPSSTFAFLTKPSLPTTTHSTLPLAPPQTFSGTRTLELSFRLASSFVLLHATNPPSLVPTSHPDLSQLPPAPFLPLFKRKH